MNRFGEVAELLGRGMESLLTRLAYLVLVLGFGLVILLIIIICMVWK